MVEETKEPSNVPWNDRVGALTTNIQELIAGVDNLNDRLTDELNVRITLAEKVLRQQKIITRCLMGGLVVLLAIAIFLADTSHRVETNTDRIKAIQTRTSDKVLCPLYRLFVAQVKDAPPQRADFNEDGKVTAKEQKRWEATVAVIMDGYAALECKKE